MRMGKKVTVSGHCQVETTTLTKMQQTAFKPELCTYNVFVQTQSLVSIVNAEYWHTDLTMVRIVVCRKRAPRHPNDKQRLGAV